MKKIMAFVLAFAASLCPVFVPAAFAAGPTATVNWTYPVQYVDGSALAASEIAFVTVTWQRADGSGLQTLNVNAPALTTTIVGLTCGGFNFTATITTTAAAKYPSATSGPTGSIPYATGVSCVPKAPTGFSVS